MIYVYASAGENIRIDVAHMAGVSRNIPLSYRLVDAGKSIIGEGVVAPGKHDTVLSKAAGTGTYALVITGGSGGQAWYGIRVHNQHMGILVPPTYVLRTLRALADPKGSAGSRSREGGNRRRQPGICRWARCRLGGCICFPGGLRPAARS